MPEITLDATLENIDVVTDFVNEQLENNDCPMKIQMRIAIIIDELFGNIARYAYGDEVGQATVGVEVADGVITLQFTDSGTPYNPLAKDDPDITLSAEEREIGGLGIFMVKKSVDSMDYVFKDNKNILTLNKKF